MRAARFFATAALLAVVSAEVDRKELATKLARLMSAPGPLGWSADGHMATANIATSFLESSVATQVSSILTPYTAEEVSTWADQVKNDPEWAWSEPLHFITTPDWACKFETSYCPNNFCLYGAILNYTTQLYASGAEQYYALKFVIHFMGDIHQPLHCGFKSNAGGNDYKGTFLSNAVTLHEVWDNSIIQQRLTGFNGDIDSYAGYLTSLLQGSWKSKIATWTTCMTPKDSTCVIDWATESAGMACTYAYKDQNGNEIESGFDLGMDYYNFTSPIVDEQLAKGGIRLAYLLNNVFSGSGSGSSDIAQ